MIKKMIVLTLVFVLAFSTSTFAEGIGVEPEVFSRLVELGAIDETGFGLNSPNASDFANTEEYLKANDAWWNQQEQMFNQAMVDTGHSVMGYSSKSTKVATPAVPAAIVNPTPINTTTAQQQALVAFAQMTLEQQQLILQQVQAQ